jgi:hypothetical protein
VRAVRMLAHTGRGGGHFSPGATLARWARPRRSGVRLLPGGCPACAGRARRRAPCCVLHRRRFFVPRALPCGRWALTPPFHPYPMQHEAAPGGLIFCDTFCRRRLAPSAPADSPRPAAWWCPDFPPAGEPRASVGKLMKQDGKKKGPDGARTKPFLDQTGLALPDPPPNPRKGQEKGARAPTKLVEGARRQLVLRTFTAIQMPTS